MRARSPLPGQAEELLHANYGATRRGLQCLSATRNSDECIRWAKYVGGYVNRGRGVQVTASLSRRFTFATVKSVRYGVVSATPGSHDSMLSSCRSHDPSFKINRTPCDIFPVKVLSRRPFASAKPCAHRGCGGESRCKRCWGIFIFEFTVAKASRK